MEQQPEQETEREKLEVELLLEGLYRVSGYDFRNYAYPSVRRRIWRRVQAEGANTVSELLGIILRNDAAAENLASDLLIHVTEMFRDPGLFLSFRQRVVPHLRTYPFIRIWHAGCSTGEEVYSTAILLHEEGLLGRSRLYATDVNENVLQTARAGIFPLRRMKEYTQNYLQAGGTNAFSEYYTAKYDSAILQQSLKDNIVFAQHNLVTDHSFNEFNVIFCRNVMIYLNEALQDRVHGLIYDSLGMFGVLALGEKETIAFTRYADRYEELDGDRKLYRKIK